MAAGLSFPVGWGVSKTLADSLGAFWDSQRDFMQPSEFLLNQKGRVLSSTYSSSPIGRIDPDEALTLIKFLSEARKKR